MIGFYSPQWQMTFYRRNKPLYNLTPRFIYFMFNIRRPLWFCYPIVKKRRSLSIVSNLSVWNLFSVSCSHVILNHWLLIRTALSNPPPPPTTHVPNRFLIILICGHRNNDLDQHTTSTASWWHLAPTWMAASLAQRNYNCIDFILFEPEVRYFLWVMSYSLSPAPLYSQDTDKLVRLNFFFLLGTQNTFFLLICQFIFGAFYMD